MANAITALRILCAAALLFCPAFSPTFCALYLTAGVSDMIDGAVARGTNTASDFGARLDTAADLAFTAACLVKLLPALDVPAWLCVWIAAIALIKGSSIAAGFVRGKGFAAVHSPMNKITGALLFALPLSLPFVALTYSAPLVCAAATAAALQEGAIIRSGGEKS